MFSRAWRRLRATPIFTSFAVASLALGLGVTSAIHAVVSSLTETGIATPVADRVGLVVGSDPLDASRLSWRSVLSRGDLADLRLGCTHAQDAAASARFAQSLVTAALAEVVTAEAVTGNYFHLLEIEPARGRLLQPADDTAPSRIAVLSHQFWQTRFGGDESALGSVVRIAGEPFEIVGIAADGFSGLTDRIQSATALWVPLAATSMFSSHASPPADSGDRRRRQLSVLIPIDHGATLEAVSAEVHAVGERLDAAHPIDLRASTDSAPQRIARSWSVRSITEVNDAADRTMARAETIVMAIVAMVLVVACTNLANLVLARGTGRQHELAVRRALGASRSRLVVQELAETGLLAALGGVGAYLVARLLMLWFASASLPISESLIVQVRPRFDVVTVVAAALLLLLSLAVFGLWPALQVTRGSLREALSGESGATGQLRWRAKRRLIAIQVAISVAFFLIAAFAVRMVVGERTGSSGIDLDRLVVGLVNFRLPPWDEPQARDAIERVTAAAVAEPTLSGAALSSGMPFGTNYTPFAELSRPDEPFAPGRRYTHAALLAATPSIFTTLGVPILHGRAFDARDAQAGEPVAVLSAHAARQVFGMTDATGRILLVRHGASQGDVERVSTVTVIGIAGDTDTQHRYSRELGAIYRPLAQHYEPLLTLIGRTNGDPGQAIGALRALARRADDDLVVDRPATAAMALTGAFVLMNVVSRAAGGLAVLALLLAMAGLFGVLSHLVARRTREMGLRMALGADASRIRRVVIADGLRPVIAGVILGLLLGVIGRLLLRAAYANPISAPDFIVFGLAPIPIIAAAVLACYWPARRAARVNPNEALRDL